MKLERDHATTAFEENITTRNRAMRKANDGRVYRAMTTEHAEAVDTYE